MLVSEQGCEERYDSHSDKSRSSDPQSGRECSAKDDCADSATSKFLVHSFHLGREQVRGGILYNMLYRLRIVRAVGSVRLL